MYRRKLDWLVILMTIGQEILRETQPRQQFLFSDKRYPNAHTHWRVRLQRFIQRLGHFSGRRVEVRRHCWRYRKRACWRGGAGVSRLGGGRRSGVKVAVASTG